MTNIEQKALELVNEVQAEEGYTLPSLRFKRSNDPFCEALCRAIERHEAFRQEVSDAVHKHWGDMPCEFDRFIITKPDPLVETLKDMRSDPTPYINSEIYAKRLRAALAKRGLEIREKSDG